MSIDHLAVFRSAMGNYYGGNFQFLCRPGKHIFGQFRGLFSAIPGRIRPPPRVFFSLLRAAPHGRCECGRFAVCTTVYGPLLWSIRLLCAARGMCVTVSYIALRFYSLRCFRFASVSFILIAMFGPSLSDQPSSFLRQNTGPTRVFGYRSCRASTS